MIKYRVTWSRDGDVIREVEVLRETPKFVVLEYDAWGKKKESRYAKRGRDDNFFDTWEEAHHFRLDRATARLKSREFFLRQAQEELNRIVEEVYAREAEAMKP